MTAEGHRDLRGHHDILYNIKGDSDLYDPFESGNDQNKISGTVAVTFSAGVT